jgi:D-glycero-beta-D-manno-heptose-7-phosphate kinase
MLSVAAAQALRSTIWHIPPEAREVYDITGAGDTVVSAFVLAFLVSRSWELSVRIANTAAEIVVGHVGTTTVRRQELLTHFRTLQRAQRRKARATVSRHRVRETALQQLSP